MSSPNSQGQEVGGAMYGPRRRSIIVSSSWAAGCRGDCVRERAGSLRANCQVGRGRMPIGSGVLASRCTVASTRARSSGRAVCGRRNERIKNCASPSATRTSSLQRGGSTECSGSSFPSSLIVSPPPQNPFAHLRTDCCCHLIPTHAPTLPRSPAMRDDEMERVAPRRLGIAPVQCRLINTA